MILYTSNLLSAQILIPTILPLIALNRCTAPIIFKLITVLYIFYSVKIPAVQLNINDVGTTV